MSYLFKPVNVKWFIHLKSPLYLEDFPFSHQLQVKENNVLKQYACALLG